MTFYPQNTTMHALVVI